MDDWIASLSRRQLVAAALKRHGRTFPVGELKPLYDKGGSIWGLPWRFLKSLVMLPIKKILAKVLIVFAVRDVALAIGKTIALGHTLERELKLGLFRDDDGNDKRRDDAKRLAKALDAAYAGIDQRIVRHAVSAAMSAVKERVKKDGDAPSDAHKAAEMETFLAELDRRVDQAFARVGR